MADFTKIEWCDSLIPVFANICPECTEFPIEAVKKRVISGQLDLWEMKKNESLAFLTCYPNKTFDGKNVLEFEDICGDFTRFFKELNYFSVILARRYNCKTLSLRTHLPKLKSIYEMHGFTVSDYVMQKEVA